jgi:hypothetical protein
MVPLCVQSNRPILGQRASFIRCARGAALQVVYRESSEPPPHHTRRVSNCLASRCTQKSAGAEGRQFPRSTRLPFAEARPDGTCRMNADASGAEHTAGRNAPQRSAMRQSCPSIVWPSKPSSDTISAAPRTLPTAPGTGEKARRRRQRVWAARAWPTGRIMVAPMTTPPLRACSLMLGRLRAAFFFTCCSAR